MVIVLVASLGATLMIGAQTAYAALDINGKPIIFTDSQGRPCTFGPNHDECLYEHLEKIPGTVNYRDYHSGYKIGHADGVAGEHYHHSKTENVSASFIDGYGHGWNKGCVSWGKSQGLDNPQENCDLLADVSSP